jgi:3D-(3,5/4)-trihydroxycyclohexane-1,2-dione acylhydrolase (decyclizing)
VRFVNVNVASMDAAKESGVSVLADAREALTALTGALAGWSVDDAYRAQTSDLAAEWEATVEAAYHPPVPAAGEGGRLSQNEVLGLVNEVSAPRDVVVCAAGSMPGDLHKMWRVRDPKGYHVEYGYSCMGYEVAGGIGVAMAAPDRDVFVMVGDGSWLMMATELVTAVQEGVKVIVVLVQNHGFASIGALSEQLGSQRFGTRYRYRGADGRLDGNVLPVDLAANAASLGADVLIAQDGPSLEAALRKAKASDRTTVVHVETDPLIDAPSSASWWDVPVSEVSTLESTQDARTVYERWKTSQHAYLTPSDPGTTTDHPATEENR